jgi:hypothetical protein
LVSDVTIIQTCTDKSNPLLRTTGSSDVLVRTRSTVILVLLMKSLDEQTGPRRHCYCAAVHLAKEVSRSFSCSCVNMDKAKQKGFD